MYNYSIKFEYDDAKSTANKLKHGISFIEVQELWQVVGVDIPARTDDEMRFLRVAQWKEKFYSCVFTLRDGAIRLISARRSRESEIRIYQETVRDEKTEEN